MNQYNYKNIYYSEYLKYCNNGFLDLNGEETENFDLSNFGKTAQWYNNGYHTGPRMQSCYFNNFTSIQNMSKMLANCGDLTNLDVSNGNISNTQDISDLFYYCNNLTNLNISNGDVSNVKNAAGLFCGCNNLTNLDVSNGDVSNIKNMKHMFSGCGQNLTNLDVANGDVSNVEDMEECFGSLDKITTLNITNGNVSNAKNISYLCYYCKNLQSLDLNNGDIRNAQAVDDMFYHCNRLTDINLKNGNFYSANNIIGLFSECENLVNIDASNGNLCNITNIGYLFNGCCSLGNVDFLYNGNTSKITDMYATFYNCRNLTNLNLTNGNTSNVIDISHMFQNCQNLKNLNIITGDVSNVKNMSYLFLNCYNLTLLDIANWNISQVSSLSGTFYNLDCSIFANSLREGDVKNVTNFSNTFMYCTNLNLLTPVIQNGNFSNAKNIDYLFGFPSLDGLQNLSLINLNICNINHANFVFACPSNLKTLNISGWNACNVKNLYGFIERGANLENVYMNNGNLASLQNVDGCFTGVPNGCNIGVPNLKIKRIFLNDRTATNLTNIRISSALDGDVLDNIIASIGTITNFSIPYEGSLVLDHPNDFSVNISPISSSFFNASASIDTVNQIITLEVEGIESGEDSITITLQDSQGHSISQTVLTTITASICSYEVVDLETTYKFILNENDYYESNNKAQNNSFALCKLKFKTDTGKLILDCINYAEASYDYGILSTVDTTLTPSSSADSSNVYKRFNTAAMNTSAVQTVTYTINDTNEHFIYIKYRKDSSVNSNNDSLQFKVRFE